MRERGEGPQGGDADSRVDDRVGGGAVANLPSRAFITLSFLGILLAFYHAWLEKAFSTDLFTVHYAPYASFYGIPYWLLGVTWFPLVFVVGLWSTRLGSDDLKEWLLALLTVGNVMTAYFWYLDIDVVKALSIVYVALYSTNYALTALVVLRHRSSDLMQGYVYGTATGAVVGLLFGPYGVAACGIGGGIFGSVRNFFMPKAAASTRSDA